MVACESNYRALCFYPNSALISTYFFNSSFIMSMYCFIFLLSFISSWFFCVCCSNCTSRSRIIFFSFSLDSFSLPCSSSISSRCSI